MNFEFATANRILFGTGTLKEVGRRASALINTPEKRALVVTGGKADRARPLLDILEAAGIDAHTFAIHTEPKVETALEGARRAKEAGCTLVIGFGGGSAMDTAKAIAAFATNEGAPLDYLEVIGKGQPLKNAPLPVIAIPTTAGTGSEVTANAVLASPEHRVKVSLRSPLMIPTLAVVDPELTYHLPPDITASTGMDALTQVIEPWVSNKANPITDALCMEGIMRAGRAIRWAYQKGADDINARIDMALASLLGGIALANAKLGAVHGFAGPIGGMFDAPHGAVCAALLPIVTEVNIRALRARAPRSEALYRYDTMGWLLIGREDPDAMIVWLHELIAFLNIPPLRTYGLTRDDLPGIVEKAAVASSMKGNPIELTHEELTEILERAI
jgi:alcohol dehydrogenase class IV